MYHFYFSIVLLLLVLLNEIFGLVSKIIFAYFSTFCIFFAFRTNNFKKKKAQVLNYFGAEFIL